MTTERFWVRYEKTGELDGLWSWDEDFASQGEARAAAEDLVDDGQAERAILTARVDPQIRDIYTVHGWTR